MQDDINTISQEDAELVIVTLWQDGEEIGFTLRQGDELPAPRRGGGFVMEVDELDF